MEVIFRNGDQRVGDRYYVFHFENAMKKDRVLLRQLWSFNKSLLVLQEFDGMASPKELNMDWCPFWIQIHGLPLGLMTEKIGIVIGESIGEVLKVDFMNDQLAWGKWMRVRVNMNITLSIKHGKMITVEGGKKVLALFRYEKFSDFCHVCGKLDHQDIDCGMSVSL